MPSRHTGYQTAAVGPIEFLMFGKAAGACCWGVCQVELISCPVGLFVTHQAFTPAQSPGKPHGKADLIV